MTVRFPLGTLSSSPAFPARQELARHDTLYPRLRGAAPRAAKTGSHDDLEGIKHLDKVIEQNRSEPDRRPNAVAESRAYTGLFSHRPRAVRLHDRGKSARIHAWPLLVQVKGAARRVQGSGSSRSRELLPKSSCRARSARGAIQPQALEVTYKGSRSLTCGHDRGRGARFFQTACHQEQAADPQRSRSGLHQAGSARDAALRREAQRVKLASELSRRATGRTLYFLTSDDGSTLPTSRSAGHLATAGRWQAPGDRHRAQPRRGEVGGLDHRQWSRGGSGGGLVVAEGTPEAIAATPLVHR